MKSFKYLLLSSGAMSGLAYIGVLARLQDSPDVVNNIKYVAGTSVGAFFALLFALKVPMIEVYAYIRGELLKDDVRYVGNVSQLIDIVSDFGVFDFQHLTNFVRHFINVALHVDDITFMELAKATGIVLTISATNLESCDEVLFSVDTHPNLSVVTAIKASTTIPLIFKPTMIDDVPYVDGALMDPLPFRAVSAVADIHPDSVLAINLNNRKSGECNTSDSSDIPAINNIVQYIIAITRCMSHKNDSDVELLKRRYKNTLILDAIPVKMLPLQVGGDGAIRCNVTDEQISQCYEYGYKRMSEFLTEN